MEILGEFLVNQNAKFKMRNSFTFSHWPQPLAIFFVKNKKFSVLRFPFSVLFCYLCAIIRTIFMLQIENIKELVRRLDTLGRCL